ncbi:hypothetical protein ACLB1Q_23440 [Escherichia coli]
MSWCSFLFFAPFCCSIWSSQDRYNTATQLESIARSVREPLSSAILKGDIPTLTGRRGQPCRCSAA